MVQLLTHLLEVIGLEGAVTTKELEKYPTLPPSW